MIAPIILSGPSGVGKTYLEKYLIQHHNFKRIQSTVTRSMRPGEINGLDYEFITEEEYKQFELRGAFVTSLHAVSAYRGLRKEHVINIMKERKIPICVLVPQVMEQFIKAYPNTIAIFLKPHDTNLLINRMRLRKDTEEQIQYRLNETLREIQEYEKLKHLYKACLTVTENNFEEIVAQVLSLLSKSDLSSATYAHNESSSQ